MSGDNGRRRSRRRQGRRSGSARVGQQHQMSVQSPGGRKFVEAVAIALEFLARRKAEAQIVLVVTRHRLAKISGQSGRRHPPPILEVVRARQSGKADLGHERRDRLPEIAQRRRRIGVRGAINRSQCVPSPRAARRNRGWRHRSQARTVRFGRASPAQSPACR